MLIGIDGNEANEVRPDLGVPTGVNIYAFELLKGIHKLQDEWKDKHKVVVYLKREPSPLLPKATSHFEYKVLGARGKWVLTKLTPYLFKTKGLDRPDVLLSPSHYAPPLSPMPKVCSIMDLGYLDNSAHLKKNDFWQLKYWTAISIRTSTRIFAISESTKREIVRHYPSATKKVEVTYLGYDKSIYNSEVRSSQTAAIKAVKRKYSIGQGFEDYVLYLGVLKPSKNIPALIKAWAKIVHEFPKTALVIGGKKGWMFDEIFNSVKKLDLEQSVIFTDYVKEEDKPLLIGGAKLFVLPSFWEGFGHDVLHAVALGTPVVASSAGSIPEVGGKAALYFDPTDTDEIAEKIKKVLTLSKVDYNEMRKRSLAQAEKFSWEDTARKTMSVLTSINKNA